MPFLHRALHFQRPGLLDLPVLFACSQLAELVVIVLFDDNLHPQAPTRQVSDATSELIGLLARVAGLPVLLLVLTVLVLFGSLGELLLGVFGIATGMLLIALTVGTDGIEVYLLTVVFLRAAVWLLHGVLVYPLWLFGALGGISAVAWLAAVAL